MAAKAEETVEDELDAELTGDETELVETETSDDGTKANTLVAVEVVAEATVDDTETLNGAADKVEDGVDVEGIKKDGIGGPSQENEGNGDVFADVRE